MADTVIYTIDVRLTPTQAQDIIERIDAPTMTDARRVARVAEVFLTQIADGGMLISPHGITRIREACGVDPETEEEIVALISEGTGITEGKHRFPVDIDPAYWPAYEEIARVAGITPEKIVQETLDTIMEREWVYEIDPGHRPVRILMAPPEKRDLEELLESPFSSGSELLALIRKALGGGSELFGELQPSNVGLEVSDATH